MLIEKISRLDSHLSSGDLTAEQKKDLIKLMSKYGASSAYVYDRFFKEGFKKWELIGLEKLMKQFLSLHYLELTEYMNLHQISDLNTLTSYVGRNEALFNKVVKSKRGLKSQFIKFMYEYGMGTTCCSGFGKREHKLYEKIGILTIVEEFEKTMGIYIRPIEDSSSVSKIQPTSPFAPFQKRNGRTKGVVTYIPIEVYLKLVALRESSDNRSLNISELAARAMIEYVEKYS